MKHTIIFLILLIFVFGCTKTDTNSDITITEEGDSDHEVPEEQPSEETSAEPTVEETPVEEPTVEETTEYLQDGMEIVEIENLKFKPAEITIDKGTTVLWIHNDNYNNNDAIVHQLGLYKKGESFYQRSPRMRLSDSWNYTFREPGEYWYVDIIFIDKMRGSIIVE